MPALPSTQGAAGRKHAYRKYFKDVDASEPKVACSIPEDEPIFQPSPPEIHFQGYAPFQTCEAQLCLRNNDKVPRRVSVVAPKQLPIAVQPLGAGGAAQGAPGGAAPGDGVPAGSHKVAPGMKAAFTVSFCPEDDRDFACGLVVVTEREAFEVPVRGTGPRGVLDFPDDIAFPATPAHAAASQTFLVTNVGAARATFELQARPPFAVRPAAGELALGEVVRCCVDFRPATAGARDTPDLDTVPRDG
ncbi:hypothetical protein WJX81_001950 [Elliptochloris bilobata]|uniref:HYDIN/VesB/CFA65-like Ig-like domain-containing protein n=1 Tax=Elliptochloris bilobata TaxID=381761 RepID=A0AAW1SC82_9CHLO